MPGLRTGAQGTGGGGGGSHNPFGINLDTAKKASTYVEDIGQVMTKEVDRLMSALDNLGVAQWDSDDPQGPAATFRTAKTRWHAASIDLHNALQAIADGLRDTHMKFDQAEQANKDDVTRVAQSLPY